MCSVCCFYARGLKTPSDPTHGQFKDTPVFAHTSVRYKIVVQKNVENEGYARSLLEQIFLFLPQLSQCIIVEWTPFENEEIFNTCVFFNRCSLSALQCAQLIVRIAELRLLTAAVNVALDGLVLTAQVSGCHCL